MVASAEASGKPETGNLKPESEIFRPLPSVLRPLMGSRADFGAHQQAADEMQDRVAAFEARHHDVLRDAARWFPMIGKSGDWLPESFPEFGTSLVTWIPAFQNLERA